MASEWEDDDVVSRARQGDDAAWAELYRRHGGRLIVWLHTMPSGDASHAPEDVAADAWLTAAQRLGDFTGDVDDFAGWLFSIARHVASNRRRTASRRATSPQPPDVAEVFGKADVRDQVAEVDTHEWTRQLLQRLPLRQAEVIACIDVVGLDAAATSEALGISAATVRVARHRGLRRLRTILIEEGAAPRSFSEFTLPIEVTNRPAGDLTG